MNNNNNIKIKIKKNKFLNNTDESKQTNVKIKIEKNKFLNGDDELKWTKEERQKLESRILNLRDDQIAALLNLVGLGFSKDDIKEVVKDIVDDKQGSGHLCILTDEADSKENLLWWIAYFEESNKK